MRRRLLLLIAFVLSTAPAWAVSEAKDCPAEPVAAFYGDVFSGSNCEISPSGDVDLFRFSGSANEQIRVIGVDLSGSFTPDICIELLDPNGVRVSRPCDETSVELNATLETTGIYTVVVSDSGNDASFTYALSLERLFPHREDWPTIDSGQTLGDEINPASDIDPFRFNGRVGNNIRLTAVDLTGSFTPDICIELLDPNGIRISRPCDETSVELNTTLTMDGVYTVVVLESGNDATFSYNLGLNCLSGTCPPKLPVCDLSLSHASGALNIDFSLRTVEPATWNLWVSIQNMMRPLRSQSIPVTDPQQTFSSSIPGFPPLGTIGFLTTLTTPEKGIICSDWETVNTGPASGARTPSTEQLENLLRAAPLLPRQP